tara:strand:+ start:303 stop:1331 length:1029 start_codon:yes stop_codon:yes gene_type:complete
VSDTINLIFGPNVQGKGALVWSDIIIKKFLHKSSKKFFFIVSNSLQNYLKISKTKNIFFKNLIYLFPLFFKIFFKREKNYNLISIGDYPLPIFKNQIVFVNQANLIKNEEYEFSSQSISFLLKRIYFKIFSKNVKKFIVQSNFMKFKLMQSYNLDKKKFLIYKDLIQKPNFSFKLYKRRKVIKLLYPSNHYEYKNHELLIELFKNYKIKNIEIYVTATKKEFQKFRISKSFRRLDYFKNHRVFKVYSKFDALIFPSFIESLGLPILEAKLFKMPIICSNLPYAKELLGNKGIFFNPLSTKSLYKSLMSYLSLKNKKNLHQKLFQYSNRKKFRSDVLLKKLFI